MRLVHHYMLESKLLHQLIIFYEILVVGQQDVEFRYVRQNYFSVSPRIAIEKLVCLAYVFAVTSALVVVHQTVEICPRFYFSSPLVESSQGSKHQERTKYLLVHVKVIQKRNSLNRLTQTHLISKYSIPTLIPIFDMPVQTLVLELFQQFIVFEYDDILSLVFFGFLHFLFEEIQFLLLHFDIVWFFRVICQDLSTVCLVIFDEILV